MQLPPPDHDPDDAHDEKGCWDLSISHLNMAEENIRSVVWATGFGNDYTYIKLPVLNEDLYPRHNNGVSEINGLYFAGLYGGSSIHGIGENVQGIIEKIKQYNAAPVNEAAF